MDYKLTSKLVGESDIDIDHDAIRSVDYDIEEINATIYWHVEIVQNARKNNIELLPGIDRIVIDAKIHEIDTQKWRYIDESLSSIDLYDWDVDVDDWDDQNFPITLGIHSININFKNKWLTIN